MKNRVLMKRFNVAGFPSIYLLKDGSTWQYSGVRTVADVSGQGGGTSALSTAGLGSWCVCRQAGHVCVWGGVSLPAPGGGWAVNLLAKPYKGVPRNQTHQRACLLERKRGAGCGAGCR